MLFRSVTAPPVSLPVQRTTPAEAPATDEVTDAVVGIVAELTGYPRDLLALDLDLEADLGVDTVKQAEVFAAVRERFGVERDESLSIRDIQTIAQVIGWVGDKTGVQPVLVAEPAEPAEPAASPLPAPSAPESPVTSTRTR